MVPDGNTKLYKIVGRYILYRDSLTNAKVKKYYSRSKDWKTFWWDLKINHTVSLNTWIKINLVSFLVSRKTWSFTNSRCYHCFVGDMLCDICRYSAVGIYRFLEISDQVKCLKFRHRPFWLSGTCSHFFFFFFMNINLQLKIKKTKKTFTRHLGT